MELHTVVILQLGRIELSLGGVDDSLSLVDSGLSLSDGCLIGLIVYDEEHLTGTHRLSLMHVDACDETRDFWTDLHILHTLDGGRIGGLRQSTCSAHGLYRKLIVSEIGSTTTFSTTCHQACSGCYKQE